MSVQRIAVYCASSNKTDPEFQRAARRLGECLARDRVTIVYGGGRVGSMGQLADGALSEGGYVVGVIPNFMAEVEWGHTGVNELHIVDDMHGRKRLMLEGADAVVALPGGTGTFEELLEAITLKRLGIFLKPIILVNTRRFYDRFQELMDYCVVEKFMSPRHLNLWQVVDQPDEVLSAIRQTPPWKEGDLQGAVVS
ncbi:MAG: TIGR00730 family Rossman fold protein [Planctomycetaceae bacterium]